MQWNSRLRRRAIGALAVAAMLPATPALAADPEDTALAFDAAAYTTLDRDRRRPADDRAQVHRDLLRRQPGRRGAQQPGWAAATTITNTRCGYQSMNVFVPESAVANQRTPIYFAVNNAGWMASYIRSQRHRRRVLQQRDEQRGRGAEGGLRLRRRRQPQPQPRRRRRLVPRQVARRGGRRQGGRPLPAPQRHGDARQRRADRRQRHQRRRRAESRSWAPPATARSTSRTSRRSARPASTRTGAARCATTCSRSTPTARSPTSATPTCCTSGCSPSSTPAPTTTRTRRPPSSAAMAAQFPAYEASLGLRNPDGSRSPPRTCSTRSRRRSSAPPRST